MPKYDYRWWKPTATIAYDKCTCGRNQREPQYVCPECNGTNTNLFTGFNELQCHDCGRITAKTKKSYLYRFHCKCGAQGIGHKKMD